MMAMPVSQDAGTRHPWLRTGLAVGLLLCLLLISTMRILRPTATPLGNAGRASAPLSSKVVDDARSSGVIGLKRGGLHDGLDAWWTFSKPTAADGVFTDRSGHGRAAAAADGTAASDRIQQGPGPGVPYALRLRGEHHEDHLVAQGTAGARGLDLGTSFTFAAWLKLDAAQRHNPWQTVFDNGVSGSFNPAFGLRILAGRLAVDFRGTDAARQAVAHNYPYADGDGSNSPTSQSRREVTLPFGRWAHVAVTVRHEAKNGTEGDKQTVAFFVDGEAVLQEDLLLQSRCGGPDWRSRCSVIDVEPPRGDLWIGREAPSRPVRAFDGLLADVRIYGRRALSAAEVVHLVRHAQALTNGDV